MSDLGRIEKAQLIVDAALELKAEKPVAIDVRELSSFADTFVIVSGRSDRQVKSISDFISRTLKDRGARPLGIEGLDEGRWVLIDCNDVIVHVFTPDMRDEYDLERLWSDAPALVLEGIDDEPEPRHSAL